MSRFHIIAIGASFGGVDAFKKITALLPGDFPAAIFVVQHVPGDAVSYLPEILSRNGPLPAVAAKDGKRFEPGLIYVARPNHHLLVKADHMATPVGPRENRMRPAIDALFRSAAVFHSTRVAAVLLTGYLDDGVLGLALVKKCGGITLVQDPDDAAVPDLPGNAIKNVKIDHVLPLTAIAAKLVEIVSRPVGKPKKVPEELMEQVKISEYPMDNIEKMDTLGERTTWTCPECGGLIWELRNEPVPRYMCHTGHSFTSGSLLEGQSNLIEHSLWSAVRMMDERAKVIQHMVEKDKIKREIPVHSPS